MIAKNVQIYVLGGLVVTLAPAIAWLQGKGMDAISWAILKGIPILALLVFCLHRRAEPDDDDEEGIF